MYEEIIFSGFGGQGALFGGQLLAYAALDCGKQVTWIPSYGPEMRGGTAHCTVVIADEEIGSPMSRHPGVVVALNLPSFQKYEPLVRSGGLMIYNSDLVDTPHNRSDVRYVGVPANVIGEALGNVRMANVSLLGALLASTGLLSVDAVAKALETHLSQRQRKYLSANQEALRRGAAYGIPALTPA